MNRYEKDDIKRLPSRYRPIGAWGYWGYTILFGIPVIGWIAWLVCALSSSNINRRSFARSYFCWVIIAVVVIGIAFLVLYFGFREYWDLALDYMKQAFAMATGKGE